MTGNPYIDAAKGPPYEFEGVARFIDWMVAVTDVAVLEWRDPVAALRAAGAELSQKQQRVLNIVANLLAREKHERPADWLMDWRLHQWLHVYVRGGYTQAEVDCRGCMGPCGRCDE